MTATFTDFSAQNAANLSQALADTTRLLGLFHVAGAFPTQANVDAVVNAAAGLGLIIPKPDISQGGVSEQWVAYRESLQRSVRELKSLIIQEQGTFIVRSRGEV